MLSLLEREKLCIGSITRVVCFFSATPTLFADSVRREENAGRRPEAIGGNTFS
jgi:hypothetical protein